MFYIKQLLQSRKELKRATEIYNTALADLGKSVQDSKKPLATSPLAKALVAKTVLGVILKFGIPMLLGFIGPVGWVIAFVIIVAFLIVQRNSNKKTVIRNEEETQKLLALIEEMK